MAELNINEETHVLPSKRKQTVQDVDDDSTKKHRLETCSDKDTSVAVEEKIINENGNKDEDEDEEGEEDYEGEDDDDSDDEEDEIEHSNGAAEVDRKGKGIMKNDKGKGKMIEESEEDDSSDEDGASDSDGVDDDDDDLSDDPLAEVDLDNILPSRTRRRTVHPGVRISNDKLTNSKDNDA